MSNSKSICNKKLIKQKASYKEWEISMSQRHKITIKILKYINNQTKIYCNAQKYLKINKTLIINCIKNKNWEN